MKSMSNADNRETNFCEAPCPLNVLLLYEDAGSALRAKRLVDLLAEDVNLIVSFRLQLWRFDLLPGQLVRRSEPTGTSEEDIVFLAAHGHHDLPAPVWSWFEQWLAQHSTGPRAIVMSLDQATRDLPSANQIQYFLRSAACRSGVDVFSHFGEGHCSELDTAIAGIRYRAETTSALLNETLNRRGAATFREWGIND